DRRHRARCADGDQLLVVDRRLAQQVPVRLRAWAPDRERQARRGRQESELPRDQRELLAQPCQGRQRRHGAGARHAVLRQGRAGTDDRRRPRVARMRVSRRSGVWRSRLMAPREHATPAATMESYFRDIAVTLDGLVQTGEVYTAWFAAE